jgi:hypothetical protein
MVVTATAVSSEPRPYTSPRRRPTRTPSAGGDLAAGEQVEFPREGQHRDEAEHQQHQRRPRPGGAAGVAHQPEQHALDTAFGGQAEHQRHRRAAAGGDDDAGEEEAGLGPRAVAVGEAEHQQGRAEGADGRRSVDPATAKAGQDGPQRADRRAAGDPQHVGVGQRVAQQHLHQRAGQGQQAAAGEGRHRARQAQGAHDVGLHAASAGEGCQHGVT